MTDRWVVRGKGALVREDAKMESAPVCELPPGTVCLSDGREVLDNGKERIRLVSPNGGWVSAISLRSAPLDGPTEDAATTKEKEMIAAAERREREWPTGSETNPAMDAKKAEGNEAFKRGDMAGAIKHWTVAVDVSHGHPELYKVLSNRAAALLRLKRFEEAERDGARCCSLCDTFGRGHARHGEALLGLRRFDEAKVALERASELDPKDAIAALLLKQLAESPSSGLIMRQLLPGRDVAIRPSDQVEGQIFSSAQQMANFMYIVGDVGSRDCVTVDVAWDIKGVRRVIEANRLNWIGNIVTHYHFDHIGGRPPPPFDAMGIDVPGVKSLCNEDPTKTIWVHPDDQEQVAKESPNARRAITPTPDDFTMLLGGAIEIKFIHTPGHTPGSQCVFVDDTHLFSGDTLFIGSCGRVDLPDSSPKKLFESLGKLRRLPPSCLVLPGHNYGGPRSTIAQETRAGVLGTNARDWSRMHGC